jgi:hypothetical protein
LTRKNTGDCAAKSSSETAGGARIVDEWRPCKFITFNFEAILGEILRRIWSPFVQRAIDEPIDSDCDIVDSRGLATTNSARKVCGVNLALHLNCPALAK